MQILQVVAIVGIVTIVLGVVAIVLDERSRVWPVVIGLVGAGLVLALIIAVAMGFGQ